MIRNWFAKRPRSHVHFTRTYGSWLDLVERWFAELTNKQLRRGVHCSVVQLKAAIREFIAAHHANPKPFIWTKNAEICPTLVKWTEKVGGRYGRVRVIKLEPSASPAQLPPPALETLARLAVPCSYEAGATLMREGDEGDQEGAHGAAG